MLLWINGPFGGGKTQTAYEIQRRLARSVVCDPEHIWTDRLTVPQVADRIATSAGLTLAPDTGSALHARVRQTWITLKHIRYG